MADGVPELTRMSTAEQGLKTADACILSIDLHQEVCAPSFQAGGKLCNIHFRPEYAYLVPAHDCHKIDCANRLLYIECNQGSMAYYSSSNDVTCQTSTKGLD